MRKVLIVCRQRVKWRGKPQRGEIPRPPAANTAGSNDDTDAWHRRFTYISFTRKFGDDPDAVKPDDKKLIDRLIANTELSGLLNHALGGLRGLHDRGGFSRNMSTEETRKIYTRLSDPVAVFIEDWCMIDPRASVKKSVLFSAYIKFCQTNRQAPIGQAAFTKRIRDMGKFTDCQIGSKGQQERGWRGLNIDGSIFDSRGNALGNTLGNQEKTLTSDAGNTDNTLQNPSLANSGEIDSRSVKVGGEGRKSVLSVLSVSTDSDSNCGESVLPSVLPDQTCGKCGCELSGQTFQGPAGLGMICEDCQAELDRTSGQGERTDEQLIKLVGGAIYRLGFVRGIHEFTATNILILELPKGTGATTETIEALLNDYTGELKVERVDDNGTWRQASA